MGIYYLPLYLIGIVISAIIYVKWSFPVAHVFALWKTATNPEKYLDRLRKEQDEQTSHFYVSVTEIILFFLWPIAYMIFLTFSIIIVLRNMWVFPFLANKNS
jgi:hypothetical protein